MCPQSQYLAKQLCKLLFTVLFLLRCEGKGAPRVFFWHRALAITNSNNRNTVSVQVDLFVFLLFGAQNKPLEPLKVCKLF